MGAQDDDEPLEIGSVLAERYEILDALGLGGFSAVYKARQLNMGKLVAVKVLLPERLADEKTADAEIARFEREMRVVASLKHPNVVPLIDSGRTHEDALFIVLEFIEGESLSQLLAREKRVEPRDALRFMVQSLDALSAAHEQGVIHRDFKPANVMITSSGMMRHAMVLDFGVAGVVEDMRADDYEQLTGEGQVPGTPAYMAPEQIRTDVLDPRIDIYAWGLTFLETLIGEKAFASGSLAKTISRQLSPVSASIPEPLRGHALGELIKRAVAKDPDLRWRNAGELLPALSKVEIDDELVNGLAHLTASRLVAVNADPDLGSDDATRVRVEPPTTDAAEPSGDDTATSPGLEGSGGSRPLFAIDDGPSDGAPLKPDAERRTWLVPVFAALVLGIAAGAWWWMTSQADSPASDPETTSTAPPERIVVADEGDVATPPAPDIASPAETAPATTADTAVPDAVAMDESPPDIEALTAACDDDGELAACVALGDTLIALDPPDYVAAAQRFEFVCRGGDGRGCAGMAALFAEGNGVQRDPARARALYEEACDAEVPAGCSGLGAMLVEGVGGPRDRDRAYSLFESACDAEDALGCYELGIAAIKGSIEGMSAETGASKVLSACDLGHARACSRYASFLEDGKVVERDDYRAIELLGRACDLEYTHGCTKLAFKLKHGRGVAPNPARAVDLYAQACVLGMGDACSDACYMLNSGDGVRPDPARALELCRKGCALGDAKRGCYRLGLMIRDEGADGTEAEAEEAFEKACRAGERSACR